MWFNEAFSCRNLEVKGMCIQYMQHSSQTCWLSTVVMEYLKTEMSGNTHLLAEAYGH